MRFSIKAHAYPILVLTLALTSISLLSYATFYFSKTPPPAISHNSTLSLPSN